MILAKLFQGASHAFEYFPEDLVTIPSIRVDVYITFCESSLEKRIRDTRELKLSCSKSTVFFEKD